MTGRAAAISLVLLLGAARAAAQQADAGAGAEPEPAPPSEAAAPSLPPSAERGSTTQPLAEADAAALPEAHRPEVEVRVEPAEGIHTGDLVTLTITARALSGDDVSVPGTSFEGREHVELLGTHVQATPGDDGHTTFVLTAELLATDPGTEELGPIRLRVVTADGVMGLAETAPVTLHIASLVANEPNAEPKPPTEPVEVLQEDRTLIWVLGILAAMVVGAIAALLFARWWSRRDRPEPPPPPPRPAWEVAFEKLDAQRDRRARMIERGEGAVWVDGVSDAVREYLGRRYGFDGLERTTDEILVELRRFTLTGITLQELRLLLSDYDLVKFAKAEVDDERSEGLLAAAYRVVRATSPRTAAPANGTAPPAPLPASSSLEPAPAAAPEAEDDDPTPGEAP